MEIKEWRSALGARIQSIWLDGIEFRRYPDSRSKSAARYFYPIVDGKRPRDIGALHQYIWRKQFGEIPVGHDVHHKDKDFSNNTIDNLEAISKKEHGARHQGDDIERKRAQMDHARVFAAAWHGSEEGIAWHKAHGKRTWEDRKPVALVCTQCGKSYQGLFEKEGERFCSRTCISRHYEQTRKYYEDRTCTVCGAIFNVKKSKPQQTCSRKCSWVVRRRKRAGLQSDSSQPA
jgi:predicted nucleic acid-binding Zn ribbon protein